MDPKQDRHQKTNNVTLSTTPFLGTPIKTHLTRPEIVVISRTHSVGGRKPPETGYRPVAAQFQLLDFGQEIFITQMLTGTDL